MEKDRKMGNTPIAIRPHHGMCLAYFQGKGYSEGFTRHMQEMKERFASDPQVKLVVDTDEICSACPNNEKGSCTSARKVEGYDCAVLEYCGLKEGQELSFLAFYEQVQEQILTKGRRSEICGNCVWDEICRKASSAGTMWNAF
jgi:hypothetical protein